MNNGSPSDVHFSDLFRSIVFTFPFLQTSPVSPLSPLSLDCSTGNLSTSNELLRIEDYMLEWADGFSLGRFRGW